MSAGSESDEITITEIVNFVFSYKWLLIGVTIASMAGAYLWASLIAKPVWESDAIIGLGHYWQDSSSKSESVERLEDFKLRLKSPLYVAATMNSINLSSEKHAAAKAALGSITVSEIKNSDLVQLKLRADSPELAQSLLQSAISEIQIQHGVLLQDPVQVLLDRRALVENELHRATIDAAELKRKLVVAHQWNSFDLTLAATLLRDRLNDQRDLYQKLLALNDHLNYRTTFNTWIFRKVETSGGPVFPRKLFTIALAAVVGAGLALLFALLHSQQVRKFQKTTMLTS